MYNQLKLLKYLQPIFNQFKQRLRKALDGDSTMGNSQDAANVVKSDLGKKMTSKLI